MALGASFAGNGAARDAMRAQIARVRKVDSIIIGGGPAGLMAAIYLARFRRKVCVVDAARSRAALIPRSHNIPGFTHGLSGLEFIDRMSHQLADLEVPIVKTEVTALTKTDDGFRASCGEGEIHASIAVLASGIVDVHPPFEEWRAALAEGLLRYCPVCDAFEAAGQRIGVIGTLRHGAGKALFLRTYTKDVTLLATQEDGSDETEGCLRDAGIKVLSTRAPRLRRVGDKVEATFNGDETAEFDVLYPAMGAQVRSGLALALGAEHDEAGYLRVDDHQRTSVDGLYGIGDVVSDLHQISVGVGHAAIAACAINTALPRSLA
jgi:thioredoxin reductase (NADPH)